MDTDDEGAQTVSPQQVLVDGECMTVVRGEERVKAYRGITILPRARVFGFRAVLIFRPWLANLVYPELGGRLGNREELMGR